MKDNGRTHVPPLQKSINVIQVVCTEQEQWSLETNIC